MRQRVLVGLSVFLFGISFLSLNCASPISEEGVAEVVKDSGISKEVIEERAQDASSPKESSVDLSPQDGLGKEDTQERGLPDRREENGGESQPEPVAEKELPEPDPCQPNPCKEPNQTICNNVGGKAECSCDKGYRLNKGKCMPNNPCSPNPCKQTGRTTCVPDYSKEPWHVCYCSKGYKEEGGKCVKESIPSCDPMYRRALSLSGKSLMDELYNLAKKGHDGYTYGDAREKIFLEVDNVNGKVQCIYTGRWSNATTKIPNNRDMNIEHLWPRSRGARGTAEADMHHLFPSDAKTNSARGSLYFGEPITAVMTYGSGKYISKKGKDSSNMLVFEPPDIHKGDVARAMFYFAVRYGKGNSTIKISKHEEDVLRRWHKQDPVSQKEIDRNKLILTKYQENRNIFIDCPALVDKVADF